MAIKDPDASLWDQRFQKGIYRNENSGSTKSREFID
jgi:hypothetical protein